MILARGIRPDIRARPHLEIRSHYGARIPAEATRYGGLMNLSDLIEKAKELVGGGGIDSLTENAGELSDIVQGDGSIVEKAQQAVETVGEGGGEAGGPPDSAGGSS